MPTKYTTNEVINALTHKVGSECPRCAGIKFSIVGEGILPTSENNKGGWEGGIISDLPTFGVIPVVYIGCEKCGLVMTHSMVRLMDMKDI